MIYINISADKNLKGVIKGEDCSPLREQLEYKKGKGDSEADLRSAERQRENHWFSYGERASKDSRLVLIYL